MCFTNQIYEDKSLSQNHIFIFSFSDFALFMFLISHLMIFIKINYFLKKIVSFGPIRAHMGPNPDRAPTRTGPQPGPGRYAN